MTGGAHVDPQRQSELLGDLLERQLNELATASEQELIEGRYERFRRLGNYKQL